MTPRLFHGPGGRDRALQGLSSYRLLHPPIGDEGLKVDDSRLLVDLMSSPPVGDKLGGILIGPLDRATGEAADALLKTLEEGVHGRVHIFTWAWDLAGVLPTIRSRTLPIWCPEGPDPLLLYKGRAGALWKSLQEGRASSLIEILSEEESDLTREDLLTALLNILTLSEKMEDVLPLWNRIRPLLRGRGVSRMSALTALLNLQGTGRVLLTTRQELG